MTLRHRTHFAALLAALREHCPPILPMRVRRCALPRDADFVGDCRLIEDDDGKPSHFAIRVDRRLPEVAACDALCHEVAHALSWTTQHTAFLQHGTEWGLAMARVYRAHEGLCA